ncbi:MAG TPA: hypothetical protein VG454_15445 [Gemmatimonadales bacterium]|nr:hypothetical protein [Gemmatimonadales bacterium]
MTVGRHGNVALVVFALLAARAPAQSQQVALLDRDIKDVEKWVREDTNDAQRTYYLALAHWKRHHWRQTDSLLRLAIRMEPRYPEAFLALGRLPYARRTQLADEVNRDHVPEQWRAAVKEAQDYELRAFRTDPMVSLEIEGIEIEEPQAIDYGLPEYQFYLRCCAWKMDLWRGRYRSAYDRLTTLAEREFDAKKDPDKVPDFIYWYRGLAAAHSFQFDAAIADFHVLLDRTLKQQQRDEIINVPLADNEFRFMLAVLHRLAGHTDSAVALFQESLEHDLGLVMAHTYLAAIYEQAGRDSDALVERQRAAELNPDDPVAAFELAVSLFNRGKVRESVTELYRSIGLNDRYAPPHYLLGRAAEAFGQPDLARDQYEQFLALASMRLANLRTETQQRLDKLPK